MIVGAGPAGLECAYMAARRGHEVHVYDKRDEIGGTLNQAKTAPYGDDELWTCVEYQQVMCEKAGVNFKCDMKLGEDISLESLRDQYDSVFLGIGLFYYCVDFTVVKDFTF